MRIGWYVKLHRLEIYIGRHPNWSPEWSTGRITHGRGARLGRWSLLACWLPKAPPLVVLEDEWRSR